ncbi:S-layer homology domain-containing protein [Bacillus mycoides]
MKKIIPIVALIGMMSLGIQEMNVKAETYKSAGSKMDFWNSKRTGTNFMNSTSLPENYKSAKEAHIEYVRLAPDKWAKDKDFLFEDKPDTSGKDFLIGNADNYQGLVKEDVAKLKADLDAAQSQGIKVVLTMLSLPGDRWRQFNNNQNDDRIWEEEKYQEQASRFWKDLAFELKDHPAVVGYNLINEPHPETSKKNRYNDFWTEDYEKWYSKVKGTPADLNEFYQKVVTSIREVDKETPIILDSGLYATPWAFKYLKPVNDNKTLYAFHMYEPYQLTSQREKQNKEYQYPGIVKVGDNETPMMWDKDGLNTFLQPVQNWSQENHVPSNRIIAEEFGINRTVPGAPQYMQDLISIFNQKGWHKSFYAFREDTWTGMNYELGTDKIKWDEEGQPKRQDNPLWDVIKNDLQANAGVNKTTFKDVPQEHWAFHAIYDLANKGIIAGYGNGIFGMGDNVTREQVAALLYRTLHVEKQGKYENPYGDVNENSTMFLEEILALTKLGIFQGDDQGNFRPKATLTRAEMAQVIMKAFKLDVKAPHNFNDVPLDSWAKDAISAVQSNHIAVGVGEVKFAPDMNVTREQYAQFLYNAISNAQSHQ